MLQLTSEQERQVGRLLSGDGCAVQIERAFSPELANEIATWARTHPFRTNTALFASGSAFSSSMDQLGVPWTALYHLVQFEDSNDEAAALERVAKEFTKELQDFCSPELPPVFQLLEFLNKFWPHHAGVAQFEGWSTSLGYIRILDSSRNSKAENDPHIDRLPFNLLPISRQFSAIMYLMLPPRGGELEVWDLDQEEVSERLQSFAILRRVDLPSPIVISPKPGDIVFLNTSKPHAVRGFADGQRVVQTCFIGCHRTNQSLVLWN